MSYNFSSHLNESFQILSTKILMLVPKSKISVAQEVLVAFKTEFNSVTDSTNGNSKQWSPERKAEASAAWQKKRADEVFYLRIDGQVQEIKGIGNVCLKFGVKESTLRCKLSLGKGTATIKRAIISKTPLTNLTHEEAWTQAYHDKYGRWPSSGEYPGEGYKRSK